MAAEGGLQRNCRTGKGHILDKLLPPEFVMPTGVAVKNILVFTAFSHRSFFVVEWFPFRVDLDLSRSFAGFHLSFISHQLVVLGNRFDF